VKHFVIEEEKTTTTNFQTLEQKTQTTFDTFQPFESEEAARKYAEKYVKKGSTFYIVKVIATVTMAAKVENH